MKQMPEKLKTLSLIVLLLTALAGLYVFAILVPQTDRQMNAVIAHSPYPVSPEAQALHDRLFIADLHSDSLLWRRDPAKRHKRGHMDLQRLRQGGVNFQIFSAVTKSPRGLNFDKNDASAPDDIALLAKVQLWPRATWDSIFKRAIFQARRLHKLAENPDNKLLIIRKAADLENLPTDQIGALLLTEGAHPLEGKLENIAKLYQAGYRAMGLQHFFDNELGGSMHGHSKAGLTQFGRQAVLEMQAQGIIIDVAHSSEAVTRDVLDLIKAPVFISHGGTISHCPKTANRNLPDDILREIVARGGLIAIGFFDGVICDISPKGIAAALIHAVNLLGEDHIALGSDFDGTVTTALDVSELAAITHELRAQGMGETQIAKVMGDNARAFFMRALPQ